MAYILKHFYTTPKEVVVAEGDEMLNLEAAWVSGIAEGEGNLCGGEGYMRTLKSDFTRLRNRTEDFSFDHGSRFDIKKVIIEELESWSGEEFMRLDQLKTNARSRWEAKNNFARSCLGDRVQSVVVEMADKRLPLLIEQEGRIPVSVNTVCNTEY